MSFGNRLRQLREKAGWTQKQLADASGISQGSIANLEQDRRAPTWETVQALAGALGVDCNAFNVTGATTAKPRGRGRPAKAKRRGKQ
jgi:transcriptional regulator with XRE-family HTH domain